MVQLAGKRLLLTQKCCHLNDIFDIGFTDSFSFDHIRCSGESVIKMATLTFQFITCNSIANTEICVAVTIQCSGENVIKMATLMFQFISCNSISNTEICVAVTIR